jgi:ankyrin repeat protein
MLATMSENLANAIESGNAVAVQLLIDYRSVDINKHFSCERVPTAPTALIYAVKFRRLDIVEILLQANADIDETDVLGRTACHMAALVDDSKVLLLLLARRPNLALQDNYNETALHYALSYSSESLALMLIDADAPIENISSAELCQFAGKSKAAICALQSRGIAIDKLYDNGTPLHKAVLHDSTATDLFDVLVNECNVDIDALDDFGDSCLHLAAEFDDFRAVDWLVRNGADVSVRNGGYAKYTPLHLIKDYECAMTLLAAGADVNAAEWSDTPINHAVDFNHIGIFYAMVAAGANLELSNLSGRLIAQRLELDQGRIDAARRDIIKRRLGFVRHRALQVCLALHHLPALQICEILLFACGPIAPIVSFHHWWKIVTTVKHFFA